MGERAQTLGQSVHVLIAVSGCFIHWFCLWDWLAVRDKLIHVFTDTMREHTSLSGGLVK